MLMTVNVTSWTSLEDWILQLPCDMVALQEHRRDEEGIREAAR